MLVATRSGLRAVKCKSASVPRREKMLYESGRVASVNVSISISWAQIDIRGSVNGHRTTNRTKSRGAYRRESLSFHPNFHDRIINPKKVIKNVNRIEDQTSNRKRRQHPVHRWEFSKQEASLCTKAVRLSKGFEKIQISVRDPLCRKSYPWGEESREPASSQRERGGGGDESTRFEVHIHRKVGCDVNGRIHSHLYSLPSSMNNSKVIFLSRSRKSSPRLPSRARSC